MAFTNQEFIIDNIKSNDIGINGVSIVRINESEIQTPFISGKNIVEEKIRYRDIPFYYTSEKQPLEFEIKFSILADTYTDSVLFELGKIFGKSKYVPFQTTDYLGKIFYIQSTSPVSLITYGSYKGWFSFTARTSAPFAFAPIEISTFDCTLASPLSPITIEIFNKSNVMHPKYNDYYYEPEMWIDLGTGITGLIISNISDGNRQTILTGCATADSIYMNSSLKQIEADNTISILNRFNKVWFRLSFGLNKITINNSCIIQIKTQFPLFI
jgi:hypothetical protein